MISDAKLRELLEDRTLVVAEMAKEIINHRKNKDSARIDGLLASRTWRDPLIKCGTRAEIDAALAVGNPDKIPQRNGELEMLPTTGKLAVDFLAMPEAKQRAVIRKLKVLDDHDSFTDATRAFRRVIARGMSGELRAVMDLVKEQQWRAPR